MSLTALLYLSIVGLGYWLCLSKDPFYGVLVYVFTYLISPNPYMYWWAGDLPGLRWSFLSFIVLAIGAWLHRDKLSPLQSEALATGRLLVLFWLLSLCVSVWAVSPEASFQRCSDFFRYILLYFILVKVVNDEKKVLLFLLVILVSGFVLGDTARGASRFMGRLEGIGPPDAADSNNLALLFGSMVPLALVTFIGTGKYLKGVTTVCVVFIVNGFILCNSRGGLLALFLAMLLLIFRIRVPGLRKKIVCLSFVGLLGFLYLADTTFWDRFNTISESIETDGGSGRMDIWGYGLVMVKDHPLGVGGDGFKSLSSNYIPAELLTTGSMRSSHNTYLLVIAEQGYTGFVLFMVLLLNLYRHLRKASKKVMYLKGSPGGESMFGEDLLFLSLAIIAVESAMVCHLAGSMFSDRLYYEFFYYLIVLIVCIHSIVNRKLDSFVAISSLQSS